MTTWHGVHVRACHRCGTDGAYFWHKDAALPGKLQNFGERRLKIFLNVVAQRF